MENNLFPLNDPLEALEIESIDKYDETDRNSYLFDFATGDFVKRPDGSLIKCNAKQAYRQWCQKVMLTPRFKKFAYPDYYGNELDTLINSGLSIGAIEIEIERMVREALMVHPKTLKVSDFRFEWENSFEMLIYSCVVTDTDSEKFEIDSKIKR